MFREEIFFKQSRTDKFFNTKVIVYCLHEFTENLIFDRRIEIQQLFPLLPTKILNEPLSARRPDRMNLLIYKKNAIKSQFSSMTLR